MNLIRVMPAEGDESDLANPPAGSPKAQRRIKVGTTCKALALGAISAFAIEASALTVYTYSSFTADWGPGPAIEQSFEEECGCDMEFVGLDDGVSLLTRLRLEGKRSKADIVLGLDTNLSAEAEATGLLAPHGVDLSHLRLPVAWEDPTFVPFDYGWFAFVYNREQLNDPPASLDALVKAPESLKIIVQDPRTSTPGLGLMLWLRKVYGAGTGDTWHALAPKILTVTKGWSEAYGLFLEGEAPLVLSYTTSPAYHRIAESDSRYAAAIFEEGHYLQVEVAAKLRSAPNSELADRFLAFVVSEGFQQHIPTGNWMFPVIALGDGLPEGFSRPLGSEQTLSYTSEEVFEHRRQWIDDWLQAMSR